MEIVAHLTVGQAACHGWGAAIQVEFEGSKENFTVVHNADPYGPGFKLLGIFSDPAFSMQLGFNDVKIRLNAKMRSLFRIRRFYSLGQFLHVYKTQVRSSVEWATLRFTIAFKHSFSSSRLDLTPIPN